MPPLAPPSYEAGDLETICEITLPPLSCIRDHQNNKKLKPKDRLDLLNASIAGGVVAATGASATGVPHRSCRKRSGRRGAASGNAIPRWTSSSLLPDLTVGLQRPSEGDPKERGYPGTGEEATEEVEEEEEEEGGLARINFFLPIPDSPTKVIKFSFRTSAKDNRILCPCKICVNSRLLGELEVYDHLIYDGFMAGYTTWIHHGESMQPSETTSSPNSQFEEYSDSDEMDEMLLEGFGMYDTRTLGEEQESEDDLDDDVEAYYRLVNDGRRELYPGCKRFSKKAKAIDGQPLADCVEVLVNIVLKETTELSRAQGKINKLGNAQARCIPWPHKNIMQTDHTTMLHSKVLS
ncbi:uncharacterized protein [Triticum aestivum]|uniref:uncharacterized protein n=1 Tax=Triticum aestivum TaxID=4565 RepID=UPI001D028C8B|nr:uncharacterized protein LOC123081479 [Triticum aestivum]